MPNCCSSKQPHCSPSLAIVKIPIQPWEEPYDPCKALKTGTISPVWIFPFM